MRYRIVVLSFFMLALAACSVVEYSEDEIVYVTKTGNKYHLSNCRYLRKNCVPQTLREAFEKGYEPCSNCGPPLHSGINKLDMEQDAEEAEELPAQSRPQPEVRLRRKGQCTSVTKGGQRCKRPVTKGRKCFQHEKK